ncbi:MAG: hypothetical protein KJ556_18755 [Gammaproteobacteria bacterium]|nr:hypothetical protein [Gammaproteobacteria bacterium]MBU2058799.1 hypothetical protein [Gammaproteobacteria bacterium]MBU2177138.1 hypothetical protein [Gammaproteobacteria bacterium]MBU2247124.1 hypothetical protein [Gammaproteobacteria bacterium]MBU2343616.1 hypothetical protein [Gammaproteobacteria bacterium]
MQPDESSEAVAKQPEQPLSPQAALTKSAEQALDQLAEIAALGNSVRQAYARQLTLTGQIATAEWQLTGRSLTIAAALVLCFGAGMILLWGSILAVLGYVLFQLSSSVAITATALLLLQFALLFWCWRSLAYVLSQAGFSNTWRQLQLLLFRPQKEDTNADPTATD